MKILKSPEFYCNLFLSITFISIFIAVFFFTYAAYVEKEIVVEQTTEIVNDFTDSVAVLFPDDDKIKTLINGLDFGDPTAANERVKRKNTELVRISIMYLSIGGSIGLCISIFLAVYFDLDWKDILLINCINLACIAATEFIFLTCIAKNFISFDPNFVKYVIVDHLDKFKSSAQ